MGIEIGRLIVKGLFGSRKQSEPDVAKLTREMAKMRGEILNEVSDMIAEAERVRREP
ncbi:MAG: hypothetical protein AAGG56_09350 [Pseudomonadota bacterium]